MPIPVVGPTDDFVWEHPGQVFFKRMMGGFKKGASHYRKSSLIYEGGKLARVVQQYNNTVLDRIGPVGKLIDDLGKTAAGSINSMGMGLGIGTSVLGGAYGFFGIGSDVYPEQARNPSDASKPQNRIFNSINGPKEDTSHSLTWGRGIGGTLDTIGDYLKHLANDPLRPKKQLTGDRVTLSSMITGDELSIVNDTATNSSLALRKNKRTKTTKFKSISAGGTNLGNFNPESKEHGMPMYFKDLRDNSYIFLRAYVSGLIENVTPSWAPINYIGRSEEAYVYEKSVRDISFNLKLFAHTAGELAIIYQKLRRLTSMCYPEYEEDVVTGLDKTGNFRMKPPLLKFRLGELYGRMNNEVTGFIMSINYTYPDTSPWETAEGARVPKYIEATINYKIIHGRVPQIDTEFYGFPDYAQLEENAHIDPVMEPI